jgi:hypothetical protein
MNPDDVVGALGALALTVGGVRYGLARRRERLALPRLCSCGHGSGQHGPDGCTAWRAATAAERMTLPTPALTALAKDRCGCLAFDASGPRAPR